MKVKHSISFACFDIVNYYRSKRNVMARVDFAHEKCRLPSQCCLEQKHQVPRPANGCSRLRPVRCQDQPLRLEAKLLFVHMKATGDATFQSNFFLKSIYQLFGDGYIITGISLERKITYFG